jgi:hypothetical protein
MILQLAATSIVSGIEFFHQRAVPPGAPSIAARHLIASGALLAIFGKSKNILLER